MRRLRVVGIVIVAIVVLLGAVGLSSLSLSPAGTVPVHTVSYNQGVAAKFHSPISSIAVAALSRSPPPIHGNAAQNVIPQVTSGTSSVPVNAIRFITDGSYMPQSETTVAVDPTNTNRVVGGVNDGRYFFCGALPASDCPSGWTISVTGFTVSADGGRSVLKSDNLPGLNETVLNATSVPHTEFMASWGDPSVAPGVHGEYFFATLLISTATGSAANGIELSVSNSNLFNPSNPCVTPQADPAHNACWSSTMVAGNLTDRAPTFEDKELISVDRNTTSPFYGDAYVSWDHFYASGTSSSWAARCTPALVCTMIAGGFAPGSPPVLSGGDAFAAFTTPSVGSDGAVHFSWCDYGTATTLGPVSCRVRSTAPHGGALGTNHTILSFDGVGTTLPNALGLTGFATEQFRTASIPVIAVDTSPVSNNLYFTIDVCASGNYYNFNGPPLPGNCGESAIVFSRSTDGGATWSTPANLSVPSMNVQPWITTDPLNGNVVVAYYTAQFDPFNHRTDVVADVSTNQGQTFTHVRVTNVSDEPNSDPVMYDYLVASGFGGSFVVPQYGDYMQVAAVGGEMWLSFTGNYASQLGALQADPWLAVTAERSPLMVTAAATPNPTDAGVSIGFSGTVGNAAGTTSYAWSFGDGATASGSATPTHAYAAPGAYTARVWANDSVGRSASSQVTVLVVTGLTALQTATPTATDVGQSVAFSAVPSGGQGTYQYAWAFGDGGSSNAQSPTHSFAAVGTYAVTLWVNDTGGASVRDRTMVAVNPLPTASASSAVSATDVGQAVAFTSQVSGGTVPYALSWDFLDGSGSGVQNPSHAYAGAGTFAVRFTLTDAVGVSSSKVVSLTINPAPVAKASASNNAPVTGDSVSFTGSGTGGTSPLSYAWAFGDGATSTTQSPTHGFANAGTYTVRLWVNDSVGGSSLTTLTVVVTPGTVSTTTAIGGAALAFVVGLVVAALVMMLLARRRKKQEEPGTGPKEGMSPPPPT